MKKHKPYWIMGYCEYTCSECGFVADSMGITEKYFCPSCNADMRELPKRCYYKENHHGAYCCCGDSHYCKDDGLLYCTRYTSINRQRKAGFIYSCDDTKLKTSLKQLSFFDDV